MEKYDRILKVDFISSAVLGIVAIIALVVAIFVVWRAIEQDGLHKAKWVAVVIIVFLIIVVIFMTKSQLNDCYLDIKNQSYITYIGKVELCGSENLSATYMLLDADKTKVSVSKYKGIPVDTICTIVYSQRTKIVVDVIE